MKSSDMREGALYVYSTTKPVHLERRLSVCCVRLDGIGAAGKLRLTRVAAPGAEGPGLLPNGAQASAMHGYYMTSRQIIGAWDDTWPKLLAAHDAWRESERVKAKALDEVNARKDRVANRVEALGFPRPTYSTWRHDELKMALDVHDLSAILELAEGSVSRETTDH